MNSTDPDHEVAASTILRSADFPHVVPENAFKGRKDILKGIIPSTITSIGDGAFSGCSGLPPRERRRVSLHST
jgi:hypothetical protein